MNMIYYAHSGLRFLVLLLALVALVVLARGLMGRRPYDGAARGVMSAFVGSLHLQLVLGIVMVVMGRFYPALIGHMVTMVLAVGAATMMSAWARRSTEAERGYKMALAGVVVSLVLIVVGISAIGRHPLESRALDRVEGSR